MVQHGGGGTGIESGLNTEVEDAGVAYHVQTQCSDRGAPVVESLVYSRGQILVRMTASFEELARRHGFTADDGRHLLGLQHADLIRKIRHGMLRDGAGPQRRSGQARPGPAQEAAPDVAAAIAAVEEPEVRALLRELDARVESARAPDASPRLEPFGTPGVLWPRRVASRFGRALATILRRR